MIFSNDYEMRRSYENPDRVQMQVQWEFDLTLYRIDRDVYSILDWIGDVGGLSEGLVIGLGAALSLVNFYRFDHYLIEQLYLTKGDQDHEINKLKANQTSIFRQKINSCFKSWRLKRVERLFAKARTNFYDEIDIVKFLRKMRRLEALEKELTVKLDLNCQKHRDKE